MTASSDQENLKFPQSCFVKKIVLSERVHVACGVVQMLAQQ